MDNLFLFILLALIAEILGTVGGFGSSLFFVPIAGYFFDFQSVLGITALFHVSSNLSKIAMFRKGMDKKLILELGIPAVLFVIIGAFMSKFINPHYLKIALDVFLVIIGGLFLLKPNLQVTPKTSNTVMGGILSGFVAGLIGTGGAIRGVTLASFNLSTDVFIATSAVIDFGIDFSRSIVYFFNGYMHKHDLYLIPILLGISIVGTYIGKLILQKVSQEAFKKIVLVMVMLTGIIGLLGLLK